jgi:hypothetical protein
MDGDDMNYLNRCFMGGLLGVLANSVAILLAAMLGIMAFFSVAMNPQLTPEWLYPRLVWGGIWGLLFLLPWLRRWPFFWAALIASLGPTLVQLFIVFPFKAEQGIAGVKLGAMMPVFVVLFNFIWALAALAYIRRCGSVKVAS